MSIRESALSLISSISQSDYLRAVTSGGNSRRVTMANAAKAVVEGYSGSSLGGSQRTVKAAIDAMANDVDIINKIAIKNTASGPIASFPDGSDGLPIQSLIADINPVQSGSGTPSPQNIRPISGHTEVDVVRTGKNLLNLDTTGIDPSQASYSDGVISIVNKAFTANTSYRIGTFTVPKTDNYIFSGSVGGSSSTYQLRIYNSDGTSVIERSIDGDSAPVSLTKGTTYSVYAFMYNGYTASGLKFYPMLRFATETDTSFEKYNGNTYTTALGRTVYGGTLDVVSGTLTVKWAAKDMGSLTYGWNSSTQNFWCTGLTDKKNGNFNIISSCFKTTTSQYVTGMVDGEIKGNASAVDFYIKWADYAGDTAGVKTALSGQTVCYELATPQTYQLTAQQIQTLLGTNNIWADSGDVDVVYIADTKLYIDNH